jgi:hypothetical protein
MCTVGGSFSHLRQAGRAAACDLVDIHVAIGLAACHQAATPPTTPPMASSGTLGSLRAGQSCIGMVTEHCGSRGLSSFASGAFARSILSSSRIFFLLPCVAEHVRVARRASVPCTRRLDRLADSIELMNAHVAPATARLPLVRPKGILRQSGRARRPRHVRRRTGPRLVPFAATASAHRLLAVSRREAPALSENGLARVDEMSQPALAKSVVPCAPRDREGDSVCARQRNGRSSRAVKEYVTERGPQGPCGASFSREGFVRGEASSYSRYQGPSRRAGRRTSTNCTGPCRPWSRHGALRAPCTCRSNPVRSSPDAKRRT